MMSIPNFFVVGAAKSGTSSIASYLDAHPDVYVSPIKEPHYFSDDICLKECDAKYKRRTAFDITAYLHHATLMPKHIAHVDNRTQYQALFREVRHETAIGELSTGYLYSNKAAKNIFDFNPSSKIVIILRQPVKRAFSHYLMNLRDGWDDSAEFHDAIQRDYAQLNKGWGKSHLYIELGLYFEQVKRYFDVFPKEQIKVFLYEELSSNPVAFMDELFVFLGVDSSLFNLEVFRKRENPASLPRFKAFIKALPLLYALNESLGQFIPAKYKLKIRQYIYSTNNLPTLSTNEFEALMPYFNDDIRKLSTLIGRDLSHWHTSLPLETIVNGDQIAN